MLERWIQLIQNHLTNPEEQQQTYAFLAHQYNGPGRFYHNLVHVELMLREVEKYEERLANHEAVQLAIWFHDLVYNPFKSDNEEQSAKVASRALHEFGYEKPEILKVVKMILHTADHMTVLPDEDFDTQLFLDCDLMTLGAPTDDYIIYAQQIRKEYMLVPEILYTRGRQKVLEQFLSADHIYRTQPFREQYEEQARSNLLLELNNL